MSAPTKDLCIVEFNEQTKLGEVKRRVLNAFLEGIMCFQFRFTYHKRQFVDRCALPPEADEAYAIDLAEYAFERYTNTVAKCITEGMR